MDRGDLDLGERLTVANGLLEAFFGLFFEDADFFAFPLCLHGEFHRGALEVRRAGFHGFAVEFEEHFIGGKRGAFLGLQFFKHKHSAFFDLILGPGDFTNGKHSSGNLSDWRRAVNIIISFSLLNPKDLSIDLAMMAQEERAQAAPLKVGGLLGDFPLEERGEEPDERELALR